MTGALISAGAAILVCLINNYFTDRRREAKADTDFEVLKATITAEIQNLTKEVEKHNRVVERVYDLETKANVFEEKMKVANHRIDDLEGIKHE
jgi:hypothetical protein